METASCSGRVDTDGKIELVVSIVEWENEPCSRLNQHWVNIWVCKDDTFFAGKYALEKKVSLNYYDKLSRAFPHNYIIMLLYQLE